MGCSACSRTKKISYGNGKNIIHSISGTSLQVIKQNSSLLLNSKRTNVINTNVLRKRNLNTNKVNFKLLQF